MCWLRLLKMSLGRDSLRELALREFSLLMLASPSEDAASMAYERVLRYDYLFTCWSRFVSFARIWPLLAALTWKLRQSILDMTTKRNWLKKMVRRSVDKNGQMEDQASNISISMSDRRSTSLQWLTWKKCLLILLVLPWCALAALYGLFCVVLHSTLFPYSVPIRILNNHRKPLWISYVGIDGRKLSDGFGSYEQGLGEMAGKGFPGTARLSSGNHFQWEMQSGMITPNISHRLVLHVHTPPVSAKKVYSCELVVPRSHGLLIIDLWENNKMSCQYFFPQYFSFLGR